MPSIFTTISEYQYRLDARDAAAISRLLDLWQQYEVDLVRDLEALILFLEDNGGRVSQETLLRLTRYQALLAQLSEFYDTLSVEGLAEMRRSMLDSARLGEAMAQAVLAGITGDTVRPFARVPVEALTQLTALAQPGGPLAKILEDAYPMAANALTRQLVSNIGRGRNPRAILKFARENGLVAGLDHILLVSRDQSVRAFRQASQASYANDPDVTGYMRMAARQTRTCPMCIALDGTTYPTDQLMEVHPQDRCVMVPVVRGFPAPVWKSARDWFAEQSAATQQKMLGPERFKLYRNGTPLTDFVQKGTHETWGPSLKLRPLNRMN